MRIERVITPDQTVVQRPLPSFLLDKGDVRTLQANLPYWQNNSPTYSGFLRWAWDFFSRGMHEADPQGTKLLIREYHIPNWYKPALEMLLRYEPGMRKTNRANAIATYREGSKTSLLQLLSAYFFTVGKYGIYWEGNLLPFVKFIRYRGKSFTEASKKVETIKFLLSDTKIVEVFGEKAPTFTDKVKGVSKNNIFLMITKDREIIMPYGIEQPARGMNILGRRPDFDIDDDVEAISNTKTPTARQYIWEEIMSEQFGGIKDDGLTAFIFNYVHPQGAGPTIVEAAKKGKTTNWNIMVRKIGYLRYDEEGREYIEPDWPERFDAEYIKGLETFYSIKSSDYAIYRREYFNEFVSEEEYNMAEYRAKYVRKEGVNWLEREAEDGSRVLEPHKVYVSIDPAISEEKKSSDAVIAVTMVSPQGIRRIHDMRVGKYDIRDRFYDESKRPNIIAFTDEEMKNVKKKGLVEETVRMILRYNADLWIVERAGQQLAWFNDIIDMLRRLGLPTKGTTYHPVDEKTYKIKTGLLHKIAAGIYEINYHLVYKTRIFGALKNFPQELDIFDALHNVEPFITTPKDLTIKMGKVYDKEKELNKSDLPPALVNPERYIGKVETYLFF